MLNDIICNALFEMHNFNNIICNICYIIYAIWYMQHDICNMKYATCFMQYDNQNNIGNALNIMGSVQIRYDMCMHALCYLQYT